MTASLSVGVSPANLIDLNQPRGKAMGCWQAGSLKSSRGVALQDNRLAVGAAGRHCALAAMAAGQSFQTQTPRQFVQVARIELEQARRTGPVILIAFQRRADQAALILLSGAAQVAIDQRRHG